MKAFLTLARKSPATLRLGRRASRLYNTRRPSAHQPLHRQTHNPPSPPHASPVHSSPADRSWAHRVQHANVERSVRPRRPQPQRLRATWMHSPWMQHHMALGHFICSARPSTNACQTRKACAWSAAAYALVMHRQSAHGRCQPENVPARPALYRAPRARSVLGHHVCFTHATQNSVHRSPGQNLRRCVHNKYKWVLTLLAMPRSQLACQAATWPCLAKATRSAFFAATSLTWSRQIAV